MELPRYQLFYDGEWHDPRSGEWLETDNPFTQETWALIPRGSPEDVNLAVESAQRAFKEGEWGKLTPSELLTLLILDSLLAFGLRILDGCFVFLKRWKRGLSG